MTGAREHAADPLRTVIGNYITALMVDGGENVAACERAMDEAIDRLLADAAAAGPLAETVAVLRDRLQTVADWNAETARLYGNLGVREFAAASLRLAALPVPGREEEK